MKGTKTPPHFTFEKPGYAKPSTLTNSNNMETENLYSVVRIVRREGDNEDEPITPVTPATPYTPIPIEANTDNYNTIRHPLHRKKMPIGPLECMYAAPKEAPPVPNTEGDSDNIECILITELFSFVYSIAEKEICSPHNAQNEYAVDIQIDEANYSVPYMG